MNMTADRVTGTFFLVFGLVMYFLVNPNFIETVDGANLSPQTMPNITCIVIAVCGGILVLNPTNQKVRDPNAMMIAAVYVALLVAGLYAISLFGFAYVSPVLALAIMLLIGERRPVWLGLGVAAMPLTIWFLVTIVLERALP